jgi:hypothetical protein
MQVRAMCGYGGLACSPSFPELSGDLFFLAYDARIESSSSLFSFCLERLPFAHSDQVAS